MTKQGDICISPPEINHLMWLREVNPPDQMTWKDFTKTYYPGHNEQGIKNRYHRERRRRSALNLQPDKDSRLFDPLDSDDEFNFSITSDSPGPNVDGTPEEDSDFLEEVSENDVEEGEVRDGEPLLHDRGLESGRILSGHKQTTDSEENIPLVRTDRSGIDRTKTTISSQMEMNTVPVIPGYQEVTSYYKSWLKRIVCANSGRSPQKVESAIIVQTFSLPSPPADPHSPNKPPSKKRKLSSDEVESGCRIAQAAMAMHRAGSVNPEPMNAGVSPMTASDGEETMTGPTPLGTKAYKSLTQVPDASGNTLSKVQGSLIYEMLQEHGSLGILDIFEKAQRYPQEKARVDRLQQGKIAATQEANEAQAQLCAEKSKVEHLRAEKAELEHIVWEKEDQVKASNQNVLDLRASLEDALDKANDADRKFRESRQENDDKTKLLEEKNKELHNYDHLKAQMLNLMTEFTLGVKLLAQSHSNLRNSVQRLHSDADWDRWRKWPLDKYGEMHEIENVRRQQALSAEGDATERLEDVDRVCRKILSVIAGVEPSGAAK